MSIVTELKYTANLDKGVCMTPITPSFMGGDQEAHRFVIDCYRQNSREAVDLSGAGVTAYFVRSDGITIPLVGETDGSKASVLLPAACYAVMGRFSLVVKLSLDDGTADSISTVFWGEGAVSRSRTDVVIDPDSVIPSLEELLAQIEAMEIATANANAAAENATQAATDATSTANAAAASAQATAEAAATQAVEIATAKGDEAVQVATEKGNEAVQIATEQVEAQNQAIAQIAADLLTKAPAIECEASGSMVTVTDAAAQPAVQLVTHIEPVQEGEGDPSPDNVRPISGWDKVNVARARKNVFNVDTCIAQAHVDDTTGEVKIMGGTSDTLASDWIVIPKGIHRIYITSEQTRGQWGAFYTAQKEYISGILIYNRMLDVPTNAVYMRLTALAGTEGTLQIEFGSVATAYEPYQGQTLTADLPETVYGGTVDWGTGVLTVDRARYVCTGAEEWAVSPIQPNLYDGYVRYDLIDGTMPVPAKERVLSESFPFNGSNFKGIWVNPERKIFELRIYWEYATVDELKAYLEERYNAGNPVTAVYQIATPRTIQLTPQQLEMLKATNNLWSDTGDTDLVYVADTKLYIDQAINAALNTTAEE